MKLDITIHKADRIKLWSGGGLIGLTIADPVGADGVRVSAWPTIEQVRELHAQAGDIIAAHELATRIADETEKLMQERAVNG